MSFPSLSLSHPHKIGNLLKNFSGLGYLSHAMNARALLERAAKASRLLSVHLLSVETRRECPLAESCIARARTSTMSCSLSE